MQAHETFTSEGFTVNIYQDPDPSPPSEFEDPTRPAVAIVTTRNRNFEVHPTIQGRTLTADDPAPEGYESFPLYAYIHSGVALSLGSFSCPWDSGQIGFVWVDPKAVGPDPETAARVMVDTWNQYLAGDVWGFDIRDAEGADVASCWGFYGLDCCKIEARDTATAEARDRREQSALIDKMMAV